VILGRGAAVILHDDERALHVLLDAPKEARVRQAMEIESLDQEAAERRLARVDRFRRAYVETFYGADLRERASATSSSTRPRSRSTTASS
jgi:cytidylate kinase